METFIVKSESDEVSTGPSIGGVSSLPKFTPGTKGAPKKITQIKFIDPEKIKQLGLEKTIAAAVHKLQVKTQSSFYQNAEGNQVGGILGAAKRVLSQNSRKLPIASKNSELPSLNKSEDGKPTSIDVKSLIRRKLQAGKRSSLNLKSDASDTISAKFSRSISNIPTKSSVSTATHTPLAASRVRKKPVASPDEQYEVKKTGRSKKVRAEKDIEGLTESELIAKQATEQIRLNKPKQYKNSSASLKCIANQSKGNISSLAKGFESTQAPDESPKKSCNKGDSSKIPSFFNLRHYLHHKRSQNEGSENSSDSTEVSKDKIEKPVGSVEEEKALEKQPTYKTSVAPISVLNVRKKGPLVKKPEETLVPGKIDVILTTDTEKAKKDEIKVLSELKIPSEESDDEPRTVVLKVINRDLKSGKIEMELIDPLIQPERVQAVVTNSTADSADAKTAVDLAKTKENIKDTDSGVDKQSTDSRRKSVESNLKVVEGAQDPQRMHPSSLDEAIDSTDLFQKHMRAIYSSRPVKKLEDVVRKLSFSNPCNSHLISNINNIRPLPSPNTSASINTKSPERKSLLEDEHLTDFDNSSVLKYLKKTPTCPLNFGGFFKKTTSESDHDGGINQKEHYSVVEETAVDFLLTVDKADESLTEESLPSDCDSASLTQFDSLFDIKESSYSDKYLNELKIKPEEDSFHNDFPFGLSHSTRDPLTVETSHSPYYELLGFENDEPVIASFNHYDDYNNSAIEENQNKTKPIIIENKILSDQEKIDTMAVLSQAGQQLSPSLKLTQNLGQDSSQGDNSVIIMGDDVPVEKEVLITMNSVDHSSHDMVEDYGFDGDSDSDVELLLMEESFESSNHTMVSKALQDQKEVEVLEIVSSAENSTNQVIVLSVEPNAEALGDAEGSIEFPFDSPIKKRSVHADIGEITKELVSNEEVGFEQQQSKSSVIIEIEKSINPEDDKSNSIEAAGDERSSSTSSEYANQSTPKNITCEISDHRISEPKETKVEEKRVRKTFKPVPKLRLALKNKKKEANISLKAAEETKQNVAEKDEAQQTSFKDNWKLIDEEIPVKIENQAFSDNRNKVNTNNTEEQKISHSSEENEKQAEDYVVLRGDEEKPVRSILRKESKTDCQRDKRKNEMHSFLDCKREGNFAESRTVEKNLKTLPEEHLSKDKSKIIVQPKGINLQLSIQSDCAPEKVEEQSIKTVKESNDLHGCVQSPNQDSKNDCEKKVQSLLGLQESNLQSEVLCNLVTCVKRQLKQEIHDEPPGRDISKNQPPYLDHSLICDSHEQSSTKNKINIKNDRSKSELKTLDYFSTSDQNQSKISEDQLTCSLQSLKDVKQENQVSKERNETTSNTGNAMYCDLEDSIKNDHKQVDAAVKSPKPLNKEGEKLVLRQYHMKNKNINNASVEQRQQNLLGLEDHVKTKISPSTNFIQAEDEANISLNMEPDEAKVFSKVIGERSGIPSSDPNSIKKECIHEYGALCALEDLGMLEAEKTPEIVSKPPKKKVDVGKTEELVNKLKVGRTKKESKISILEKWSHTEGRISPIDQPYNNLRTQENKPIAKDSSPNMDETYKSKEKLKCEKSFETEFNKTIISTPNSIVKKKYNRKSKPASISKGYSVMKVAGESNEQETSLEEAAVDAYPEPSTSNGKRIKIEVDFATPETPAEIPKKRGRKPRSSQNATMPDLFRVAETPLTPPYVPASAEVSRRGRIIKLTEKRRLSDIFNESKAKAGRKRKIETPTVVKKEPENDLQVDTNEGTIITNNSGTNVEYEVAPAKKPKQENIIKSEHSDSDSDFDIPLIKAILKAKSKNGDSIATPIPKSRGRKKKNTSTPKTSKEKDTMGPKRKPRGRKYDIEIKLHPKLLLVTKREDLYKKDTKPLMQVDLKDGEVRCGLCKEVTLEDKWKQHIETHYCIGWKEGEPPVDVEDYRIVLNAMNYYMRHNHIEFVTCRLCGLSMMSAMGVLYHLESCKATLEEKKEMNYICVCGKVLQSKLWAPPHYKSCKGVPTLAPEEPEEIEPRSRKRKAVLKAEKIIKEKIREELEQSPDDLMKPIVNKTVGCMTKWRFQLRKKGVAACVGTNCKFASKDLSEMHAHSKTCEKILWTGFSCVRCRFEHAEKDVVWAHVQQKHILENTADFEGSDTDAKIGSESSDSDFESGDDDNERKRKPPKKRKRKPTTHTELYSDKWKKVYPLSANGDYLQETTDWTTSFRETNYSKKARFTYAIPEATVLPYTAAQQYFAHNIESMKFSYNLEQLCNRRFSSSIKPELWSTLGMFESKTTADEIMTFIGGPVTNVSWVPVGDHETSKQYLALTYKKDLNEYAKYKDETPYKTCMLVYEIEYELGNLKSLTILYGVALDSGPVLDIQFLPSGGYAPALNRLGLVAVASKSTDPQIYSLPLKITENCDVKGFPIVALRHAAILRFEPDSGFDWTRQCTALVWSKFKGHNVIVGGLVNGFVAVWDISEQDNLNQINKDDERCIIPTNYFHASERRVLSIDLHYDARGARWLILTTECKTVKVFDLREIIPYSLTMDDFLRTVVYNLVWPVQWENPILCYSDEMQRASTGIISFSSMGLMYHYRKAIKCASGAITGSFIDWQNAHVAGFLNGDLLGHRLGDWRHDVALQTDFTDKYLSYTDLILLSGEKSQLGKMDPNILIYFDKDYKQKYGLILSKFQPCGKKEKEISYERDVHFTLQQYVKINRVAGNPNAYGKELVAAGYENGLLRICLYNPIARLCTPTEKIPYSTTSNKSTVFKVY